MSPNRPLPPLPRRRILATAAALPAMSGRRAKAAPADELRILHTDPALVKVIHEQIAAHFISRHPGVQIRFDIVPTYNEALAQSLRDGMTGNAPDIAFHGLNNIGLLARRGLLAQLDPFIDAEPSWKDLGYSQGLKDFGRADGRIWGLPFALSTLICYYNASLLRDDGWPGGPFPAEWPGIIDLAARARSQSGGIWFSYQSTGNVFLFALMCSMGAKVLSDDRRTVLFDSPQGLQAMQVLQKIGQCRAGSDLDVSAARHAFGAGTLGILVDSSSSLTNFLNQAGDRFDIETAPIPLPIGAHVRIPSAGNAATIMARDPERRKLAWEYVKFATSPPSQTILAEGSAFVPVNDIALAEPELLGNFYREKPKYQTAKSMLPYLTGWEAFPGPNSLRIDTEIQEQVRDVLVLRRQPDAALAAMAKLARDLMSAD